MPRRVIPPPSLLEQAVDFVQTAPSAEVETFLTVLGVLHRRRSQVVEPPTRPAPRPRPVKATIPAAAVEAAAVVTPQPAAVAPAPAPTATPTRRRVRRRGPVAVPPPVEMPDVADAGPAADAPGDPAADAADGIDEIPAGEPVETTE